MGIWSARRSPRDPRLWFATSTFSTLCDGPDVCELERDQPAVEPACRATRLRSALQRPRDPGPDLRELLTEVRGLSHSEDREGKGTRFLSHLMFKRQLATLDGVRKG